MKDGRHIIWSNDIDYDDWREDLEEQYPDLTEAERMELMYELNSDYLDDERSNLDIQLSRPILVVGDLGLWNGRRMGYKEIPSGNIRDCLYSERDIDYSTWYVDKNGDFRCDAIHHDGTNHYLYRAYKNSVSDTQIENLKEQQKTLTVDIAALQAQQRAAQTDCNIIDEQRRKKKEELEKAETELAQTRREIKTDKLKGVAVDATTKAVERIGALFHDPKPARYEKQIADLQGVIADKDKCIGQLQQEIKTMQAGHDKEVANLKQEAQQVIKALMRVDELCPYVKGLLKWENYCKDVGLDKERTKALFTMQPYRYTGELHSIRYNHTFRANDVILQFKPDKDGPSGFQFTINGKDCDEWFRQQRKEFYERIGIDIEQTEQRRGMKM